MNHVCDSIKFEEFDLLHLHEKRREPAGPRSEGEKLLGLDGARHEKTFIEATTLVAFLAIKIDHNDCDLVYVKLTLSGTDAG
jgi:hypothetical protein